ncbi:MAG: cytochrome c maturation protein CcmE [Gemmatimonadota bacterium]
MTQGKRRMWAGLGLATVVGAILYLAVGSLESNMVYFLTPAELQARAADVEGQPVRLDGMVQEGSVTWNPEKPLLTFAVGQGDSAVRVRTTSAPPSMFKEGEGVVVEGTYGPDGVFHADRLMVKHSNEYRPPEDGKMPEEMYESIRRSSSGAGGS